MGRSQGVGGARRRYRSFRWGFLWGTPKTLAVSALLCTLSYAVPVSAQSLLPELQRLRAEYPAENLTKVEVGELLTRTAQSEPGWFLLRKPVGNRCPVTFSSVEISCDILIFGASGQAWDVLRDTEGEAEPQWNPVGVFPPARYLAVPRATLPPGPPPTPPIPPSPAPPDDAHEEILARLTLLEQAILELNELTLAHGSTMAVEHNVQTEEAKSYWRSGTTYARDIPIVAGVGGLLLKVLLDYLEDPIASEPAQ